MNHMLFDDFDPTQKKDENSVIINKFEAKINDAQITPTSMFSIRKRFILVNRFDGMVCNKSQYVPITKEEYDGLLGKTECHGDKDAMFASQICYYRHINDYKD